MSRGNLIVAGSMLLFDVIVGIALAVLYRSGGRGDRLRRQRHDLDPDLADVPLRSSDEASGPTADPSYNPYAKDARRQPRAAARAASKRSTSSSAVSQEQTSRIRFSSPGHSWKGRSPGSSERRRSIAVAAEADEDLVGLDGVGELGPGAGLDGRGETGGHGVRLGRVALPEIAAEQNLELGGGEAHLGGELERLLAQVPESVGQLGVEEDDGFADEEAVLGAAEGEASTPPSVVNARKRRRGPRRRWRGGRRRCGAAALRRGRARRARRSPRAGRGSRTRSTGRSR